MQLSSMSGTPSLSSSGSFGSAWTIEWYMTLRPSTIADTPNHFMSKSSSAPGAVMLVFVVSVTKVSPNDCVGNSLGPGAGTLNTWYLVAPGIAGHEILPLKAVASRRGRGATAVMPAPFLLSPAIFEMNDSETSSVPVFSDTRMYSFQNVSPGLISAAVNFRAWRGW